MSSDLRKVYQTSMAGYQAALLDEQQAFQRASAVGDVDEQVRASQALAALRVTMKEYDAMARDHARTQQAPQGNKWGLSNDESEIARNSFGSQDLTNDQREEIYARNKAKYRSMLADGTYSNSQGSVRRG